MAGMEDSFSDDSELLERVRAKIRTALEEPDPIPIPVISVPIIRFAPRTGDVLEVLIEFKCNGIPRCVSVPISGQVLVTFGAAGELLGALIERTAASILAEISKK